MKVCGYTSSAKFFRPFGENCSVFWGRQGETTHGHEGSFSRCPWRFLHVVNKGIKSGSLQSRLTAVDLPRGVCWKELTSEKKCPAAIKERKKDYWTSKSVAHARITRESRSQSQSHRHRRECPEITYMAMGFRPHSFPVGGMYMKGTGRLMKV